MIPKIIHYCWLGNNPYPEKIQRCIDSWHKVMPDYEFVLWDENSFDINTSEFTRQAYAAHKWAFVSDYIRLYALYNYGGIYLDTDVLTFKRFDDYLHCNGFSSVESYFYHEGCADDYRIEACVIGATKGNQFIKDCLEFYDNRHFVAADGTYDEKVINLIMAEIAEQRHGFRRGHFSNECVEFDDGNMTLYPPHVFTHLRGDFRHDSVTLHLYMGSWRDKQQIKNRIIYKIDEIMISLIGVRRWSLMRWSVRKHYLKLKHRM